MRFSLAGYACCLLLVAACAADVKSPSDPGSSLPASGQDAGGYAPAADGGYLTMADGGDAEGSDGARDGGPNLDAAAQSGADGSVPGRCDPGSTDTVWAQNCATTRRQCTPGSWRDPGSTTNDPLVCESAHFAVHAPSGTITPEQCQNATQTLETVVWPTYFEAPILFPEPYCDSATKWKASITIHSDWGLTGGAWGNGYMGMWVGPGATSDHWGLAHEFAHAVQGTTKGLACGADTQNYCGFIWESHANFMPHQLAEYRDEVHCSEMLVNAPHLYLGSTRDRYCNWQFMEYLKDKYCYEAVNDIWTAATPGSDPFVNIARSRGFSTSQLNDFFGEWAMHNVTWDYRNPDGTDQGAVYRAKYGSVLDASRPERLLRTTRLLALDAEARRYAVPSAQAPQRWGYNVVQLKPEADASEVRVAFRGVLQEGAHSDWRWGLLATNGELSRARYSPLQRGADGALSFCVTPGELLFLVVMGTPSVQQSVYWDQPYPTVYRYPYMVELQGASPAGHEANAPSPTATGQRWQNGGGWVAQGADVAQGAYVGPDAVVRSGTVSAGARIEDSAIIDGASIRGGTVGGVSVLTGGFSMTGGIVRLAWPYGPGFFERPVSLGGSGAYLGDLELRGANTAKSSGAYCGFVDANTASNCAMNDVNNAGPYTWRP